MKTSVSRIMTRVRISWNTFSWFHRKARSLLWVPRIREINPDQKRENQVSLGTMKHLRQPVIWVSPNPENQENVQNLGISLAANIAKTHHFYYLRRSRRKSLLRLMRYITRWKRYRMNTLTLGVKVELRASENHTGLKSWRSRDAATTEWSKTSSVEKWVGTKISFSNTMSQRKSSSRKT